MAAEKPVTPVIRIASVTKEERRAILLLTPEERRAALLVAARELQAALNAALNAPTS